MKNVYDIGRNIKYFERYKP